MKKTRFLYGRKILLTIVLVWLALLNEGLSLNVSQKEAYIKEQETREEERKKEAAQKEAQDQKEKEAQKKEAKEKEAKEKEAGKSGESAKEVGQEAENPLIRVVLMDSDYQSYLHPSVSVTCQGESLTYTPDSPALADGPVILQGGEAGISVSSILRQDGSPLYWGSLEIYSKDGGLLLINELPLETYLEAVVPSEMPASYEKEALMAQAVCARTYAWKQMEEGRMKEYDADVDDSVNYQVYGNISPQEQTTEAVRDTQGEVMRHDGELIEAYYFSTSAGATSTDEIWGAQEAAAYLKSVDCSFDSGEPWSRWSVELPWSSLSARAQALPGCAGALVGLEVVRKNESGAVTCLRVVTEEGSSELSEEYAIREFLSPQGCTITEKDGTSTEGGKLLPSAYFSMETVPGSTVSLQGGGYGHGVGMSQNAANEMAKEGYTYDEILDYFFKDICIEKSGA